jgi:hypothetical protein
LCRYAPREEALLPGLWQHFFPHKGVAADQEKYFLTVAVCRVDDTKSATLVESDDARNGISRLWLPTD